MESLEEKIKSLPPELRQEVMDFIEFQMQRVQKRGKGKRKFTLSWAGALKDYRDKFTSLELQKRALEWRD